MSPILHSEMGLAFATPFWKTSHTLPTPPNSPPEQPKNLKRHNSRFRFPKLLKRTQSDSTALVGKEAIRLNRSCSSHPTKRPMQNEPNGLPFHVFQQAIQPLPLGQPSLLNQSAKDEPVLRTTSRKLKKMPKSHNNLRACKSVNQLGIQPPKPQMKTPVLLPSPLPSDSEESQGRNAYFAFRNPRGLEGNQIKPAEGLCEYEDIVAGYCEDVFAGNGQDSKSSSAIAAERDPSPSNPSAQEENTDQSAVTRTPPTSNMSATLRSPKRDRSSSLSSEATWLSKSFANQEQSTCIGQLERIKINEKRLAEKARRCCHLVQGPNDDLPASWTGERKAVCNPRHATTKLLLITL